MKRVVEVIAAAIIAASLASCSASEATPPPADGGTFQTIEELKVAVNSAGLPCTDMVLDKPPSKFAAESATCGEFTSLALYSDDLHLQSQLDFLRPSGQRAVNIGKNWTVISEDPNRIQKSLGGTVLHTGP
ncbi:hypothetical protein CXX84_04480 [Arthrobacter sp. AFG7.2]|uniref:hypothetical protein n=1 Tax=Arthrobacter sp. AFG7.2 TaxID=1688693 RepID=UPI000C9E2D16|nr:hypothetical protein [Arthrobacter sp. AFG7.2]PNI09514.1 hypothetical protein CXX84_04480 [Arthrobacter sp. AFG7.2]